MARSINRSHPKARAWSPIDIVLTMTVGMMALVSLFHFIFRIAA